VQVLTPKKVAQACVGQTCIAVILLINDTEMFQKTSFSELPENYRMHKCQTAALLKQNKQKA